MSDRLLAIESATDSLSVALLSGDELLCLKEASETRQHSSVLLPLIHEALGEVGWGVSEIEALAVSAGPGAFTSLRIGLATAKGLAFGRSVKAIGVSTLATMAARVFSEARAPSEADAEVVALLDARRGEWYAGGFRRGEAAEGRAGLAEGLYAPEHLAADLTGEVIFASPEPPGWEDVFRTAGVSIRRTVSGADARPRADWVARLAIQGLAEGRGIAARDLAARYLRRAEAEAKRLGGPVETGELARVDSTGS